MTYPNLCASFDWAPGVYKAPAGYQHGWLAVTRVETTGHWSEKSALAKYNSENRLRPIKRARQAKKASHLKKAWVKE